VRTCRKNGYMAARKDSYPAASPQLDWASATLGFAFMCGLIGADGWAHAHYISDSYFTPAHAIFFSAFTLLAAITLVTGIRNRRRGYPWSRMLLAATPSPFGRTCCSFRASQRTWTWHLIMGREEPGRAPEPDTSLSRHVHRHS